MFRIGIKSRYVCDVSRWLYGNRMISHGFRIAGVMVQAVGSIN